jgi:hypothetical protein
MYLNVIKYFAPVVVVFGVVYLSYDYGVDTERKRWKTRAYEATIKAHESASKFTAGVLFDHKETATDAQTKIDQLDNVVDNSIGLREQLDALQKRHSDDRARSASYSKTAQNTIRVLSRLLNESDHLAGVYAENADRNRIAGQACERAYNDLAARISAK